MVEFGRHLVLMYSGETRVLEPGKNPKKPIYRWTVEDNDKKMAAYSPPIPFFSTEPRFIKRSIFRYGVLGLLLQQTALQRGK
jgi:hypothetical protein